MKKLRWMLCGIAISFAACGVSPAETTTTAEGEQVQTITRTIGAATETCTETFGVCKPGFCEGRNDVVQLITEVCCTNGVCETERYRLCGC
jgi:hypothetical protein